jgi:colanic acid biosynthesis glycosyl transferase WcaI
LSGAKTWLHIQDFELDAALGLGILPLPKISSPLAAWVEAVVMRNYDRVSAISKNMVTRLIEKGVSEDRAIYFPNWVDTEEIYPLDDPSTFRNTLGIGDEQVVVLYAGNLGYKQGLEVVVDSARELMDDPSIVFVFAGEGAIRSRLQLQAKDLPNVRFIPLQPAEELNALLNAADIHILPQKANAADLVMPSKLLGILASGKPVIAMAEINTELEQVIQQVGSVIPPEEITSLVSAIRRLSSDRDLRDKYGESGRDFVKYNWDRQIVLKRFEAQLERLTQIGSDYP